MNFSEGGGDFPSPFYLEAKDLGRGIGGGIEPEIPTGENEIKVFVNITYQIK